MPKITTPAHWASFVPKISPEPSLRKMYKNYKVYNVFIGNRSYSICFNGNKKAQYYNTKLKGFNNWEEQRFIDYCKSKGVEIELIADEANGLWYL